MINKPTEIKPLCMYLKFKSHYIIILTVSYHEQYYGHLSEATTPSQYKESSPSQSKPAAIKQVSIKPASGVTLSASAESRRSASPSKKTSAVQAGSRARSTTKTSSASGDNFLV